MSETATRSSAAPQQAREAEHFDVIIVGAGIRLGAANTPVACTMGATGVWAQCTGSFTAAAASERLDLLFGTANGTGTIAFDDVTVTQTGGAAAVQPVPTLSEWALLALAAAAGGLGLRRLRRNG